MHEEPRQSNMNGEEPEWDALSRFVAGESDPNEASAVVSWLAAHPADAKVVDIVKAHADRIDAAAHVTVDVEAALRRVRAHPDFGTVTTSTAVGGAKPQLTVSRGNAVQGREQSIQRSAPAASLTTSRRWGRLAFAAAAAVVAVLGVRQIQTGTRAGGTERVLATGVGVRDSLLLPDGSKIVLAPSSRVVVSANFDAGDRTVTLEGAGFFDIKHDDARPFTVHSAGAEIRDLGTAFSVKTDAMGHVAVAVTHGIVALRDESAPAPSAVELRAGDRGVVAAGAVTVTRGTVSNQDMAWTRGQLNYRDASLAEVQSDLKRWYGLHLQVADSSLSRLTVTMPAQPNADGLISTLAAALGAIAEQRGDTVFLRSARSGTTP